MATRTLEIDLRQGTGASSEPMYGVVTVQRAKAKSAGGFEILPFETSLKLINGKATITEAETDGTGPFYDSAYLFRVQNGYCAPRWGFMAALPDGSTPITTGELPMVDPITGEGIYMDAQEWNDLYGTLPNRVSGLEDSQATQDGRLDSIESKNTEQDTALDSLENDMGVALRFVRNLEAGENFNDLTAPGIYGIPSAAVSSSLVNNPTSLRGNVIVSGPASGNRQQTVYSEDGRVLSRSTTSSGFSAWGSMNDIGIPLPQNITLQDYRTLGTHQVGTASWAGTISGRPPINPAPAILLQYSHNSALATFRMWIDQTGQGIWFQRLFSGWQPWERMDGVSGDSFDVTKGHYGGPNALRLDAFVQDYPLVSTENKAAVVIRWDHGLTNFKTELQPLHEQYQIPAIIAMNSRNWDKSENAGMSKAEAAALAAGGLIEWGNHGADGAPEGQTHIDDPTKDGLWEQIVEGRRELEADLGINIHAYLRPGTSGTQGGLGNISNMDQLTGTYAGALVLGHHAVTSGYFPNSASRLLDGRIKQGQAHWNMEQATVASVKTQIDNAIAAKRCLCIMGHPRNLNKPGYYTTADVQEIFAYINQKIQDGALANISPLQSLHAEL